MLNLEPMRIEAESMTRQTYGLESGSFASEGEFISLIAQPQGATGTASFDFNGPAGFYKVVVGYFDENDGVGRLEVRKQGILIDAWDLDQNLGSAGADAQTLTSRTVATGLEINPGETIQIQGTKNNAEHARVDYIELIPTGDPPPPATPLTGKLVNLDVGISFEPDFDGQIKLMPLGDSITLGVVGFGDSDSGGYRPKLWDKFQELGLDMNFVGSLFRGPNASDNDHNGYGGRTIDWLAGNDWSSGGGHPEGLPGSLRDEQPDVITLMAGTNDARTDSVTKMISDMNKLINDITTLSPETLVQVASIPPIDPAAQSQTRVQRAEDFNVVLPDIVANWADQGRKVTYVDMTSLTLDDISDPDVDNGLHPNLGGYEKIAQFWYDAFLETAGKKEVLSNLDNAIGSAENDKLIGNQGSNVLEGGPGNDYLIGGGGRDTIVYSFSTEGYDRIADFGADDLFQISASGFGGGLIAGTPLSESASATTGIFVSDANPTSRGTSANFLYNLSTGVLKFDRDGIGAADAIDLAYLDGTPSLRVDQFTIVA